MGTKLKLKIEYMKQIFLGIVLIVGYCSYGQDLSYTMPFGMNTPGSLSYNLFDRNVKVVSKYDTTILYKGDDNCSHLFAGKQVYEGMFSSPGIGCCVIHDAAGCPDAWSNEKKICTICLKHVQIKETRTVIKLQDDYEIALEKLNILINKK